MQNILIKFDQIRFIQISCFHALAKKNYKQINYKRIYLFQFIYEKKIKVNMNGLKETSSKNNDVLKIFN